MVVPDHWRVFCAIHLPQDVRKKVSAQGMKLRQALPEANASWSRPDNIHLTVKFLGDIPESRVRSLSSAAANAVMAVKPFPIGVRGSGVFPNLRAPRVLWVGIEDLNGTLAQLYLRFEQECAKAGFKKEARAFHPHLTLARLRKPQHARTLAEAHTRLQLEPIEFTAAELLVIRSELSSAGSKYTTISRHPFAPK